MKEVKQSENKKNVPDEDLTDEALDAAAGGFGGGKAVVTCTLCRQGRIAIPTSGPWAEACPQCGARMICLNGVLQYCVPSPQIATPDRDTDIHWL